jgi:hypothetical protein
MRFDAGNLGDVFDQQRQVGRFVAGQRLPAAGHRAAVGIDVLAEQGHLLDALRGQTRHFGQDVVEGARDLFAARVGNDAERAELAAALHDRDERRRRLRPAPAADGRTSRFRGRKCRPATCPGDAGRRINCGRRCRVCGPKTTSTYGARATIAAPSWLATQPPTPITRSGWRASAGVPGRGRGKRAPAPFPAPSRY